MADDGWRWIQQSEIDKLHARIAELERELEDLTQYPGDEKDCAYA